MALDDTCSRFSALADPLRLRMLALMRREGELCVCELTHALAIPQPKASKHLAILRAAGLVRMRRDAQWVLYTLSPEIDPWLAEVMATTARDLETDPQLAEDHRRLTAMCGRADCCHRS